MEEIESKGIIKYENIVQVYSTDESESERVIVNESSTNKIKSKIIHKSININKEEYAIDEIEDEELLVIDNPVIDESLYFNLFKCG